ncbi:MAG: IMP cyclohydrolase [Desulfonatronovibrio sp.]|nr:IMP cyclohydrolase [Desulfovibrionales bacterium]
MRHLSINRALISVTDKTGIVELARFLGEKNVEIVSTGGTAKIIRENNIPVTGISDVTAFPEILGGRVKTLHPAVHAGVLADKDNPEHGQTIEKHGIKFFDLVCVNLYDFAGAVIQDAGLRDAVEKIDIGGPTLLRAAAKNFFSVCVLPHPDYYSSFMKQMNEAGSIDLTFRQKTAWYTFDMTSRYDQMIAEYMREKHIQ